MVVVVVVIEISKVIVFTTASNLVKLYCMSGNLLKEKKVTNLKRYTHLMFITAHFF